MERLGLRHFGVVSTHYLTKNIGTYKKMDISASWSERGLKQPRNVSGTLF